MDGWGVTGNAAVGRVHQAGKSVSQSVSRQAGRQADRQVDR